MAFQSDNLKKIVPMDISHLENFLSNRQIMIEEKLLKCYAEETASRVMVLVTEYSSKTKTMNCQTSRYKIIIIILNYSYE